MLYAGDPLTTRQVEAIGAFALPEGETRISAWLQQNHSAMPGALAECVARLAAKAAAK